MQVQRKRKNISYTWRPGFRGEWRALERWPGIRPNPACFLRDLKISPNPILKPLSADSEKDCFQVTNGGSLCWWVFQLLVTPLFRCSGCAIIHILNVSNCISFEICTCPWYQCRNQDNEHIHHPVSSSFLVIHPHSSSSPNRLVFVPLN